MKPRNELGECAVKMKDAEKKPWINEKIAACVLALSTLTAAKRQAASEYDSRIRKINALSQALQTKLIDEAQLELFKAEDVLDGEVSALLRNPLGGLD